MPTVEISMVGPLLEKHAGVLHGEMKNLQDQLSLQKLHKYLRLLCWRVVVARSVENGELLGFALLNHDEEQLSTVRIHAIRAPHEITLRLRNWIRAHATLKNWDLVTN